MAKDARKRTDAAQPRREERDRIQQAVNALDDRDGQRTEPPRQFAESARKGEDGPKDLDAAAETGPPPASSTVKHKVAAKLPHDGAEGEHPDPQAEGGDQMPDRIIDRG